ncbi:MAG: hypothetical protein K6E18_00145 [Lachnospiraceae bacterium]|nr:hypothetical protein [Lachnospiraceae bacterium]
MNQYVTGTVTKQLREKNKMTPLQLAEKLGMSDKRSENEYQKSLDLHIDL